MDASTLTPLPAGGFGEQRDSRRARCLLAGFAVWDGGRTSVNCVIQDLSEGGARLKVPESTPLPSSFAFLDVASGRAFEAEVAWRRYPQIGIRFKAPIALDGDTDTSKILRRLWMERRLR